VKAALLAECSPKIGSGHTVETRHLLSALQSPRTLVVLSRATPKALVARFPKKVMLVDSFSPSLAAKLVRLGVDRVLFNFKTLSAAQVAPFKRAGLKVLGMTAHGRPPRNCDAGITLDGNGPWFLPLDPIYARLGKKKRKHRGPLKKLLIVMGGTDSSGATLKVIARLGSRFPRVQKLVCAGPNFTFKKELAAVSKTLDASWKILWSPPRFARLMASCDAAITFGSDTSFELACVGTPAALSHEAPHERRQAKLLAARGCGLFVDTLSAKALLASLKQLEDPKVRQRLCDAGKRFVDGRGAERVASLLKGL
jgi:spore coat polysaccharide biosynthesis predicted glycosyltransferase SpsG